MLKNVGNLQVILSISQPSRSSLMNTLHWLISVRFAIIQKQTSFQNIKSNRSPGISGQVQDPDQQNLPGELILWLMVFESCEL